MNRWLSAVCLSALLVAIVGAQGQTPGISPADQARLYQRNKQLVRAAIESSLDLSDKNADFDGYFARTDICTRLAKRWAAEVESAAKSNDRGRTVEMAGLLDRVIDRGVVANIKMARQGIEVGSQSEKDLIRRRDDAIKVLTPLEEIEPARESVKANIEKLKVATKK
jgi:hypothetical protein